MPVCRDFKRLSAAEAGSLTRQIMRFSLDNRASLIPLGSWAKISQAIKALERNGFKVIRTSGSHHILSKGERKVKGGKWVAPAAAVQAVLFMRLRVRLRASRLPTSRGRWIPPGRRPNAWSSRAAIRHCRNWSGQRLR